jgi:hypothetical protein
MSEQSVFAQPSTSIGTSAQSLESVAEENKKNVKNFVNMKVNPNPLIVITGVIITIIIVYIFWILLLQSSPEGIWFDTKLKNKYEIKHNKMTGKITINIEDKVYKFGIINGSTLNIEEDNNNKNIGIWDVNKIIWVNPDDKPSVWVRELALI